MLLTNDLTNICDEISKTRLMAYACNVKGLEEVEKMSRKDFVWVNVLCITDQDHQR